MILEVATLTIKPGKAAEFEAALREASPIISAAKGHISHDLQRCIEVEGKYLFLVKWQTVDDHMVGFRQSADYQEWRKRLHHFYESVMVEHYELVDTQG